MRSLIWRCKETVIIIMYISILYTLYTLNLGSRIAVPGQKRGNGGFEKSTERARKSVEEALEKENFPMRYMSLDI